MSTEEQRQPAGPGPGEGRFSALKAALKRLSAPSPLPSLSRHADSIIIGGGLGGIALAYTLARRGVAVCLVEAGSLGSGTTAACAGRAQLADSPSGPYLELVRTGLARLATLSAELDCDLEWAQPGHLTLLRTAAEWETWAAQVAALRAQGVPAELLDLPALREAEPAVATADLLGAAYAPEGRLNPFKLCLGLARAAARQGALFRRQTPVIGFERTGTRLTAILTPNERISGETFILATGAWTGELLARLGLELPLRFTHAEAAVSEPLPPVLHHHIGMAGFYETVHAGDRSVTLGVGQQRNGTIVISNAIQPAATIDRRSTAWGLPALAAALLARCPSLAEARLLRTWAAPSPFLPDALPALGRWPEPDNLWVATGFHLAVPTVLPLSELLAEALLSGVEPPALLPFRPARFGASPPAAPAPAEARPGSPAPPLAAASPRAPASPAPPPAPCHLTLNGRPLTASPGTTVAAVLLAAGLRHFRQAPRANDPRGLFCGMGICYECLVTINGVPNVRACITPVADGMSIETTSGVSQ